MSRDICSPIPATIRSASITRHRRRRRILIRQAFYNAVSDVLRIALVARLTYFNFRFSGAELKKSLSTINSNNRYNSIGLVAGIGCRRYPKKYKNQYKREFST